MLLQFKNFSVGLDEGKGDFTFLSHAHSDHLKGIKKQKNRVIASVQTLELAGLADLDPKIISMIPNEFDEEKSDFCKTKMLEAGHILGSKQIVIEADGQKIAYSGDFSTKPNIFGWKADIPECDHLIMEATYGEKEYVFPPFEEVYESMRKWIKQNASSANLIVGGYELGKAQQIIKIFNECGIAPVVLEKTANFCSIYKKHGVNLDWIKIGTDEAEEAMKKPFCSVVPIHKARKPFARKLEEAFERKTLCAVATGWALSYKFDSDFAFPLSDHADHNDLVEFAEASGAKKIEFFCGDGTHVLDRLNQKILA